MSLVTVMYTKLYETYRLRVCPVSAVTDIWLLLLYALQYITHFLHFPTFPSEYSLKQSAVIRLIIEIFKLKSSIAMLQTHIQNLECFFL